ncbi:MAG: XamI family restriction endonuclease [Chloroflexota bacterium]
MPKTKRNLRPAPRYSRERLDTDRKKAIELFIAERRAEGDALYRSTFEDLRPRVGRLFAQSDNLTRLTPEILVDDPELLESLRFLAAPPISEDDLNTLTGTSVAKRKTLTSQLAGAAIEVISEMIDRERCPWLASGRAPSASEVEIAIKWTASILAIEALRTDRRTESATRQQAAVRALLKAHGLTEVERRDIQQLDDLPRGQFCAEVDVAGSKCDVPVRLWDGRLLTLECKVSNSGTNSVKRLIRETGGKVRNWREEFGRQFVGGAVLAGVYKLVNLIEAQEKYGMCIFWEHDLAPLAAFTEREAAE